ncbi:MAG: hypothetical protein Q4C37_07120 [Bacteroidales bacterium]|nr:hypothetical protein [Bacteroidales bacterium]
MKLSILKAPAAAVPMLMAAKTSLSQFALAASTGRHACGSNM